MSQFHTILHPTDLSDGSESARQLATALARDYGARLVMLHVYPAPLHGAETVDRGRSNEVEDDILRRLRDFAPEERGVEVECRASEGDPAEEILSEAQRDCDLIVMGTHGRSGLGRMLMGSTAERVSRDALCPVVTVRSRVQVPRDVAPSRVGAAGPVEVSFSDGNNDIGGGDCRRPQG